MPIMEVRPKSAITTGVMYPGNAFGLMTEIEEREAAKFNGYNWTEWQKLDTAEKVMAMAFMVVEHQIEMLSNDALEDETKKRMKQHGGT